jgi:hypothetical protein
MLGTAKFAGTYRYVGTCDVNGCGDAKLKGWV